MIEIKLNNIDYSSRYQKKKNLLLII